MTHLFGTWSPEDKCLLNRLLRDQIGIFEILVVLKLYNLEQAVIYHASGSFSI